MVPARSNPRRHGIPSGELAPLPQFALRDDGEEDTSDAEKTLPIRPVSAADILEVLEADAEPLDIPITIEEPLAPRSIAPVAIEVPLPRYAAEPPRELVYRVPAAPAAGRGKRTAMFAGALSVAIALLCAAAVRQGVRADAHDALAKPAAAAPPSYEPPFPVNAPAPAPGPASAPVNTATGLAAAPAAGATGADGVPVVDIASLPPASDGTIVGVPEHRLFIDGHLARGSTALVRCGNHVVKVGGAGRAHTVDVPCGGEIAVR